MATTVKSFKSGRKFEVRSHLYGTSDLVQKLYYGGIFMCQTGSQGLNCGSLTIEEAIEKADDRAEKLGIEIEGGN
jgi:hypothetical protein